MSIFNSLGSNYDFWWPPTSNQSLTRFLENKYQKPAILTFKGRDAIELGLKNYPSTWAVGITGFTCFAVYEGVVKSGHRSVFIDLEKDSLNFSARTVQNALQKNPDLKIIIVQNTLGFTSSLAHINNLILVEDLAHCVGAQYPNGKEAGTIGEYVFFSFSQDKMIDAITGGALLGQNKKTVNFSPLPFSVNLKNRFYPLFTYFIRKFYPLSKPVHWLIKKLKLLSQPMPNLKTGYYKLPTWNEVLAVQRFKSLKVQIEHRRQISQIYFDNLPQELTRLVNKEDIERSSCLRFPIVVENREVVLKKLKNEGIYLSDIWYDAPVAPKRFLSQTTYKTGECPNAEKLAARMVNLPTHKNVSVKDVLLICEKIKACL